MALLNRDHRISVQQFASLPALNSAGVVDIPEVIHPPTSIKTASSIQSSAHSSKRGGKIDLEEGCIFTKSIRYTHQLAHFVNAVRTGSPKSIESMISSLMIVPKVRFTLNDECNLAFLEPFVHSSLDLYALIALTPSLETVDRLIANVQSDNNRRQGGIGMQGNANKRSLNFNDWSFTDPQYELVVLHPAHFLPGGGILTVYDRANGNSHTNYVVSHDGHLRESVDDNSTRLPPFPHDTQQRNNKLSRVNVFLVAINAEIKFRRYFRMAQRLPPLSQDIIHLMTRVMQLIDLLYWEPPKAPKGKGKAKQTIMGKRKNPPRTVTSQRQPEASTSSIHPAKRLRG